jgi:hypothetical protein
MPKIRVTAAWGIFRQMTPPNFPRAGIGEERATQGSGPRSLVQCFLGSVANQRFSPIPIMFCGASPKNHAAASPQPLQDRAFGRRRGVARVITTGHSSRTQEARIPYSQAKARNERPPRSFSRVFAGPKLASPTLICHRKHPCKKRGNQPMESKPAQSRRPSRLFSLSPSIARRGAALGEISSTIAPLRFGHFRQCWIARAADLRAGVCSFFFAGWAALEFSLFVPSSIEVTIGRHEMTTEN